MSRTALPVILLLTILSTLTNALSLPLLSRQTQTPQQTPQICMQYSMIANFSVVGSNATLRAAYLAASPEGSDPARAPLDSAMLQLPNFQFNATINSECGNLTTIAFKQAEVNFTEGIVLQFKVGVVNSAMAVGGNAFGMALLAGFVGMMVL
jgi:hypothetical protein